MTKEVFRLSLSIKIIKRILSLSRKFHLFLSLSYIVICFLLSEDLICIYVYIYILGQTIKEAKGKT
jgi:hypothetical protein